MNATSSPALRPIHPVYEDPYAFYAGEVALYGQPGIGTILSRAWVLFKKNYRACLLLMVIPAMIQIFSQIAFTFPAYIFRQGHTPAAASLLLSTMVLSGPAFLIAAFFVHIFCACTLVRILHSAIIRHTPSGVRETMAFMVRKIPILMLWFVILGVMYVAFAIANVIVIITAFFFVSGLMTRILYPWFLGHVGSTSLAVGGIVLALLAGAGALVSIIGLFGVELSVGIFPILSFCISGNKPVSNLLQETFAIIMRNMGRIFLLSPLLLILFFVISIALQGPLFLWAIFESYRTNQFHHFPLHVSLTFTLVSNLINVVISGYLWSVLILFWDHARIGAEGLDIQQRLAHLQRKLLQKNKQPIRDKILVR